MVAVSRGPAPGHARAARWLLPGAVTAVGLVWAVLALRPRAADSQAAYEARHDPDRYAWELLLASSRPVNAAGQTVPYWDTWASPDDLFVSSGAPQWPHDPGGFMPGVQDRADRAPAAAPDGSQCFGAMDGLSPRLNRASFDYVVRQGLWNPAGLAARQAAGTPVRFPPGAVTLKAAWRFVEPDPSNVTVKRGALTYTLVAVNLASKVLGDWFWATFENRANHCLPTNPYLQNDTFGYPDQWVNGVWRNNTAPTDRLRRLAAADHVSTAWLNFRLVGVQTGFTAAGKPTLLGNSVIERHTPAGMSSCISCHAEAAVAQSGVFPRPEPATGNVVVPAPQMQLDFVWSFFCSDPKNNVQCSSNASPAATPAPRAGR